MRRNLDEYKQLDTMLTDSLDWEEEMHANAEEIYVDANDEVDKVNKMIQTALHDIIQHDKK